VGYRPIDEYANGTLGGIVVQHLKSWWAVHSIWLLWVLHFEVPSVQAWIDGHPKSMIAAILALVLVHMAQWEAPTKV
jgi:hypothetical protein